MNTAPSLRELQLHFLDAVLLGNGTPIEEAVTRGDFTARQRVGIYRNNCFTNLTHSLEDVFPIVLRLVGTGFFKYAAHEYIKRHPSRSGNLHEFGRHFPDFLQGFSPARSHTYLADVALLEWRWHMAFHAASSPSFPLDRLADVPSARHQTLRFRLAPSAFVMASAFPVGRIWMVNQPGYEGHSAVTLDHGGDRLLIVRPDLEVEVRRLSPGEHALLAAFQDDQSLGDACDAALVVETDLDVGACLRDHIRRGTISDFEGDK